jgi:hypothetical protein
MNNDALDLSTNTTTTISGTTRDIGYTPYTNYYRPNRLMNRTRELSNLFSHRSRYQSPTTNYLRSSYVYNNNYDDIINNTLQEEKKFKNVLSREGFKQLRFCVFTDEEFEKKKKYKFINNTCCISQTKFKDNDIVVMLPCNHIFNPSDILFWLTNRQSKCPCCRYELKSTEKRITSESYTYTEAATPTPPTNDNYIIRSNTSLRTRPNTILPRRRTNATTREDPAEPPQNNNLRRRPIHSTRVIPFQSMESDSETDTEVQELIDNNNTNGHSDTEDSNGDIDDDHIGEPYIATSEDISNIIQSHPPNITNNINELLTTNIPTPMTRTTNMFTNDIQTNGIPLDINALLHNLRSLSQTTIDDPSNSTLNPRYNFLEEYIENSYLESNEIQRTLYESLSYSNLQPNITQENSHPSQEPQREEQEDSNEEDESSEEDISTEDELFSDIEEWSDSD